MALYSSLNRSIVYRCCIALFDQKSLRFYRNTRQKSLTCHFDALDEFTSQLIQKKTDKWETQRSKSPDVDNVKENTINKKTVDIINIRMMNARTVNILLQNAIDNEDHLAICKLINQCIEFRICPATSILIHIISMSSQSGDKETVLQLTQLCEEFLPGIVESNSYFKHFLAEAIWVKGDVNKALEIFEIVYRENAYTRRRIRLMLKNLMTDVVSNKSEAALYNIVRFSEMLVKEFKDFYPLTCIWQACFLSEWFTDQILALELLKRNDGLCKSLINRIPYVVVISLRSHRTEVVYRLLEVLLRYEMNLQYSGVLLSLLDYQFRHGDILSCSEIVSWAVENEVELPTLLNEKFIKLLLGARTLPIVKEKSEEITRKVTVTTNYKF